MTDIVERLMEFKKGETVGRLLAMQICGEKP